MKVKKFIKNKLDSQISTAILMNDGGRDLYIFSDFDEEMTYTLLKCYIDGKYEKVTEEC